MAKDKIRVSKPPEERRQEIMDTAMRVFAEKGYEQTTMRDIASAVGVVPGLCYRYFESKQVLFEQAVRQYVSDYCAPIVRALKEHSGDMSSAFGRAAALFLTSGSREKYDAFFHKEENRTFHTLLSYSICDYMLPFAAEFFDSLNANGTISISDTKSFSQFILYGQIPIINDESLTPEEKAARIKEYMSKLTK